jgi:hypothetical protein
VLGPTQPQIYALRDSRVPGGNRAEGGGRVQVARGGGAQMGVEV